MKLIMFIVCICWRAFRLGVIMDSGREGMGMGPANCFVFSITEFSVHYKANGWSETIFNAFPSLDPCSTIGISKQTIL